MIQGRFARTSAGLVGLALFGVIAGTAAKGMLADKPVVVVETNQGNITIELEPEKAPKTVANFLKYVDKGYYNGTIFHRVIGPGPRYPKGFMIQGGGFTPDLKGKRTDRPVENESLAYNKNGMSNLRGTIAMARTGDPHSATSQFFINLTDENKGLDTYQNAGYTAFGRVTEGMDVVDKIAKVETREALLIDDEGHRQQAEDVPTEAVVIKSIKRKGK